MAKTKIDKDDIKRLVENTSNPSSTTSVYSAKYVDDNFLKEITKSMVEAVLTGVITSHEHNYTALSQALVDFSATSGSITSSDTILSAINKLAYDKHIHSNLNILDLITAAFTTELKAQLSQAYSALHTHTNKTTLDAIEAALTNALKANYDSAYTHSQSTHAPTDALTNRTIKVEGEDKAGSATTIPLNFKSGDGVINIAGQMNSGILDIIFSSNSFNSLLFRGELSEALYPDDASFQSGNLLNGIYDIIPEITYYYVPNESCGTDASKSGMKGSLVSQLNGVGTSLVYHCFNTNNIYMCSGTIDDVTGNIIWSNWKRLLTCKDNNEIPDDLEGSIEGEGYLYQINSSYQRIILNSEDVKNKTVDIDLKLFNSQIGAKLRIIIEFDEVSTSPDINIIDSSTPAQTINYSASYYTDPASVANVYRVEYEIFNLSSGWLVSNKIY